MYNNSFTIITYLGGTDDNGNIAGGLPKCSFLVSLKIKYTPVKLLFLGGT